MNLEEFSKSYFKILTTDLEGLNLTAIRDFEEFHQKQILDSLIPLDKAPVFLEELEKCGLSVDIGFGGGFPLVPLAWKLPSVNFLGFEARGKKAMAVQGIAEKLLIKNVKTYHQRYEVVLWDRPAVVTFKAVAKIPDLLKEFISTVPLTVAFYKGPNVRELEDFKKIPKGWQLVEEISFTLPSGEQRILLVFRGQNVPRGTNVSDSKLVKLSRLI